MSWKRRLRVSVSKAEMLLFQKFSEAGLRFETQKVFPLKDEVRHWACVDFYFPDIDTVLEIDGVVHQKIYQAGKDEARDKLLREQHGVEIIRIPHKEAVKNPDNIVKLILRLHGRLK